MRFLAMSSLVLLLATPARAADEQPSPAAALPSVELPSELERVLRDYERAWQARDAAALAALFTEDGFVLSNGRSPVRGRASIREAYANAGGGLALRALAYATSGSMGYIIGAFGKQAGNADTGKFILALRRGSDGRWLISADMDNSSQRPRPPVQPTPPPPPPPPALPTPSALPTPPAPPG